MPLSSFDAYRSASAAGYAEENVASGRWPADGAVARAIEEFDQSLPNGLATPFNHVYEIRDEALGETVGVIWFAEIEKNGVKSAFVYDVEISRQHRKSGHASAAFRQLEPIVRALGLSSIGLHVFSQNVAAQALYRSLGYGVVSLNMLKHLGGSDA